MSPSCDCLFMLAYLLFKQDWVGKVGAEAVVIFYSNRPCSPLTALCLMTSQFKLMQANFSKL